MRTFSPPVEGRPDPYFFFRRYTQLHWLMKIELLNIPFYPHFLGLISITLIQSFKFLDPPPPLFFEDHSFTVSQYFFEQVSCFVTVTLAY